MRAKAMRRATGACLLVCGAALACGGGPAPPPEPGVSRGTPPDLRGARVMLLPVQQSAGIIGDPDAELAFGLQDRGRDVEWVLPAEVDEILARSPGISASTRGLPVGAFAMAEVNRIGDPLYGELRRMAVLVNAEAILLPVRAYTAVEEGQSPRILVMATLIEPVTGRVLWFAISEGDAFPPGDPRGLASAVDELARTLLWYVSD